MNVPRRTALPKTLAIFVSTGLTLAAVGCSRDVTTEAEAVVATIPAEERLLPKAVTPVVDHDFGVMRTGEKGEYGFVLRNEGEADLKLYGIDTTCKCTVGEVESDTIPPGEEAVVTVAWNPDKPYPNFAQRASVSTNDPEKSEVLFTVTGRISELVLVEQGLKWNLGSVGAALEPVEVSGAVHSPLLESFDITGVETDSELTSVTWEPLSDERLAELEAKSGYEVTAAVDVSERRGKFREGFKLLAEATYGDEEPTSLQFPISVVGQRSGEIVLVATPKIAWNPAANHIDLGIVEAAEGFEAPVMMFVAGMGEEPLEITGVDDPTGQLSVASEFLGLVGGGKRQRHRLMFSLEPPLRRAAFTGKDKAEVVIRTTHPRLSEVKFFVSYQVR